MDLKPENAWRPWAPSETDLWDLAKQMHLFRRAGFAPSAVELQRASDSSPAEVVDALLAVDEVFHAQMDSFAKTLLAGGEVRRLPAWWLYRMVHSPQQLSEKLTLFWHGHFATSAAKVTNAKAMFAQHQLLREQGGRDFQSLVSAISRDPAMLTYLDSTDNRKTHPNENYARELMELFCLGLGNYSEQDVQQVARCFTGWQVRRGAFRFNAHQHDVGEKEFLGQRGEYGGEDAVRIILQQPAAATFIARKLVRFFVADEPELTPELIEPLANQLRESDFDIIAIVRTILTSRVFYHATNRGRKVRSPVELVVGTLRTFGATFDLNRLANRIEQLGQLPFFPPSVKGWDGGRHWINTSTLIGRASAVNEVVTSSKTKWLAGGLDEYLKSHRVQTPDEAVDFLLARLVAVPVDARIRGRLVDLAAESGIDQHRQVSQLVLAISLLPEFQLS